MKRFMFPIAAAFTAALAFVGCKKEAAEAPVQPTQTAQSEISQEVLAQIKSLGFSTSNVQKVDDGYLVEGDILLTKEHLNSKPKTEFLRVGDEEQYRTSNTVLGLPRTVTIRVSSSLPYYPYVAAIDSVINRYNALGLLLKFARVTYGGQIVINPAPSGSGYLASAGFPFDSGNPYNQVRVNRAYMDYWNFKTNISILAHEIGHCIGFRHTDYMNRSYSCGGSAVNEGASTVGAKHIPGTPVGPDPNSFMLSCIGNGVNRPFNANDKIALDWLY